MKEKLLLIAALLVTTSLTETQSRKMGPRLSTKVLAPL